MNRNLLAAPRLRFCLGCVAAVASPLYYWLRTQPFPRRTPVGVERRLFATPETANVSIQATGASGWLVTADWGEPPAPPPGTPTDLNGWWVLAQAQLRSLRPFHLSTRPPLAALPRQGTWKLEGDRLRYLWRLAGEPRGERYLWAYNYGDWSLGPLGPWVFDPRTGRTYRGATADQLARQWSDEEVVDDLWATEVPSPLSPALDEMPPTSGEGDTVKVAGETIHFTRNSYGEPEGDLIARTEDPAPRTLKLASRANLMAISGDGRTAFLRRGVSIWRLDLRQPLPLLLDEASLPELPLSPYLGE